LIFVTVFSARESLFSTKLDPDIRVADHPGASNPAVYFNDLTSVHLASSEWKNISTTGFLPSPRASMGFAEVDGSLFVFGGNGTGKSCVIF
jgi:hypothetical protein